MVLREVFRKAHNEILLSVSFESDSLDAQKLIGCLIGDNKEPGGLLELGEVRD